MRRHLKALGAVAAALLVVGTFTIGNVMADEGAVRKATLTGAEEVPGPGDPDGSGRARIRLDKETSTLCYKLSWEAIGAPTASHIHKAAKGASGDVVVTLFATDAGTDMPDTVDGVNGCIENVDAALLADIKKNPGDYYVNVHNAEFPGGAIRGQLRDQS